MRSKRMLEQEGEYGLPIDGHNERQHCKFCREAYPNEYELADHVELNHASQWCGFDHEHIYVRESFPDLTRAKAFLKDHPLFSRLEV